MLFIAEDSMYVHIGGDYSIPDRTIIGIFDFDKLLTDNEDSIGFLRNAEVNGITENVSFDIPRSVIVAVDKVYISPVSSRTIRNRINSVENFCNSLEENSEIEAEQERL